MTEQNPQTHPPEVLRHIGRLYDETRREHACRAETPDDFAAWQARARPALADVMGLRRIGEETRGHRSTAVLDESVEDMGAYTRRRGRIETEADVWTSFWLLRPKGDGPFPLALTPHGHENGDTYVGIWTNEREREQIEHEDQDVAAQAAARGFLTIAPATRGIGTNPASFRIADIEQRHNGRDCHCHNWQSVLAGRCALAERVWDLMRLLDWALTLPEVDGGRVLLTGNSGGGMATLHTAACDERITVAVSCCAYNSYVNASGASNHCPCNVIPGILRFGEYWDVAGLVAPRPLMTLNGARDPAHPVAEIDPAVAELQRIYTAAGVPDRYQHRYGDGGHRIYSDLLWPFVDDAFGEGYDSDRPRGRMPGCAQRDIERVPPGCSVGLPGPAAGRELRGR